MIIASSRSGSNLLVRYVRQIKAAASFGEIFRDDFPTIDAWRGFSKRLDLPPDAARLHERDLTAFWDLVLTRILERKRWASAKIFYYHRRGDPVWQRFASDDHLVIHLWRDSTFDQYVSRLRAVATGEWKGEGGPGDDEVKVAFDRDEYLEFRAQRRRDILATRETYGGPDRYVEIEYAELTDAATVVGTLESIFGERVRLEQRLERQLPRPKIEYLSNPDAARAFEADSITGGFAGD